MQPVVLGEKLTPLQQATLQLRLDKPLNDFHTKPIEELRDQQDESSHHPNSSLFENNKIILGSQESEAAPINFVPIYNRKYFLHLNFTFS
jgi:hypothetical protein